MTLSELRKIVRGKRRAANVYDEAGMIPKELVEEALKEKEEPIVGEEPQDEEPEKEQKGKKGAKKPKKPKTEEPDEEAEQPEDTKFLVVREEEIHEIEDLENASDEDF